MPQPHTAANRRIRSQRIYPVIVSYTITEDVAVRPLTRAHIIRLRSSVPAPER